MPRITQITHHDFERARHKALLSQLLALVTQHPNELLPFDEVRARLHVHGRHYLGFQIVPINQIVGSEGRYSDFDRQFAPRHAATKFRWIAIARTHHEAVGLPPVELYKLSDLYFVKDGHHRLSVARAHGQTDVEALVTELEVDVPLDATLSIRDLLHKEEYSDFLEWTGLAQLRPDQRIELSELGGYLVLIQHINTHRYYMGEERGAAVSAEEATVSWYDTIYLPVIAEIRASGLLRSFAGRSEADLYCWIMEHRWHLRERNGGNDPGPSVAVHDYLRRFGRRSLVAMVGDFLRSLR